MQLIKLQQVFGKLVGFYHGAARNVLFLVHRVGKGSIANVFEIRQRLQGHRKQSEILKKILLFRYFDHHQAPVASGQLTKLAPHAKSQPGKIHGDANHLGIAAIPGNRGNGQFDRHWLAIVVKDVGMRKIGWLTRNRQAASI
ncbi:uncharacterized protein TNCV_1032331 [Trichonephila clavipes]|nr:uncharacterized protein TNCV_1032331 [Trichonephila clavipes]